MLQPSPVALANLRLGGLVKAKDLMTDNPACVTPEDPLRRVAQLMADNDCGCLPVVEARENNRVVGVITDRDIALRGIAKGKGPDTPVREVMTVNADCCPPDATVEEVERVMTDRQIRRVVIADADGCCVGIIAQADLARAAERNRDVTERELARVVERISEPASRRSS
jgi:CBS domain-containing protein